jgi:hypothetical protein
MADEETPPAATATPDVQRALADLRRKVLDVAFPKWWEDGKKGESLTLVTRIKRAHVRAIVATAVWEERVKAAQEKRRPNIDNVRPLPFALALFRSDGGKGVGEAIKLGQIEARAEPRSIRDRLMRRR